MILCTSLRLLAAVDGRLLVGIFGPAAVFAQTDTGRILGSVLDESGGVVANAAVTITDTERGISRNVTTNQFGEFVSPNLLAGDYLIRVSSAGFKNVERRNILLEVAKDVRIDFVLQPGDTQTTITITVEVPLVDSSSAVLGGTLSNESINELPLNGRNFFIPASVAPGRCGISGSREMEPELQRIAPRVQRLCSGWDRRH